MSAALLAFVSMALLAAPAAPRSAASRTAEAEHLAAEAVSHAPQSPDASLAEARKALALTADFEPTEFVGMGRKGEVVEDAYVAARTAYRRHRAVLYRAVGLCLSAAGRHEAALRYLRRAHLLDPESPVRPDLARALLGLGRGREALDVLLEGGAADLDAQKLALLSSAADAARLPSLQVAIDRARIRALPGAERPELRDGPPRLKGDERLSTGERLRLDGAAPTLLYLADASCRSCSADLEAIKQAAPDGMRVLVAPEGPDRDEVLRRALRLYRFDWPLVLGPSLHVKLGVPVPGAVVVARRGYLVVELRPPLDETLRPVLALLARDDVRESVPRAAFDGRPLEARPAAPPVLLPEGLAPGEDEPAPEQFTRAVAEYRAGRPRQALALFDALAATGDGWLLPPEARLDRALCLAALGRREEARRILLRIGDSRFQDGVDRVLERVGSPPAAR
jgi:tetratricopeptide (TPR) repeat protein